MVELSALYQRNHIPPRVARPVARPSFDAICDVRVHCCACLEDVEWRATCAQVFTNVPPFPTCLRGRTRSDCAHAAPVHANPFGLGDLIAWMTTTMGIQPCGGCRRRKRWANRWFPFSWRIWTQRLAGLLRGLLGNWRIT